MSSSTGVHFTGLQSHKYLHMQNVDEIEWDIHVNFSGNYPMSRIFLTCLQYKHIDFIPVQLSRQTILVWCTCQEFILRETCAKLLSLGFPVENGCLTSLKIFILNCRISGPLCSYWILLMGVSPDISEPVGPHLYPLKDHDTIFTWEQTWSRQFSAPSFHESEIYV